MSSPSTPWRRNIEVLRFPSLLQQKRQKRAQRVLRWSHQSKTESVHNRLSNFVFNFGSVQVDYGCSVWESSVNKGNPKIRTLRLYHYLSRKEGRPSRSLRSLDAETIFCAILNGKFRFRFLRQATVFIEDCLKRTNPTKHWVGLEVLFVEDQDYMGVRRSTTSKLWLEL